MQPITWSCCPRVAQNPLTRAFIEHLAREQRAASTVENYSRDLEDFLAAFADTPFTEMLEADEVAIARYVDWLHEREARRGGSVLADQLAMVSGSGRTLAPATIRRRVCTVRVFYSWCIRLRHRRDVVNPVRLGVRGRERGVVPRRASVPWVPDERAWSSILEHLLTHMSVRDQALVLLTHDGALRREEVVRLRVDDIDWRTHTIAVHAAISKNHMPGTVVLSHPTFTRLKEYVAGDRAMLVQLYGAAADGPIFLSDSRRNPGQPLTKWTVKDIFDRLRDALDLPHLTPYTMRHLMLTELKRSGMDLLDVSRYGRHRSLASTEIYLHTDLSDLARSVARAHERVAVLLLRTEEGHDERE